MNECMVQQLMKVWINNRSVWDSTFDEKRNFKTIIYKELETLTFPCVTPPPLTLLN